MVIATTAKNTFTFRRKIRNTPPQNRKKEQNSQPIVADQPGAIGNISGETPTKISNRQVGGVADAILAQSSSENLLCQLLQIEHVVD